MPHLFQAGTQTNGHQDDGARGGDLVALASIFRMVFPARSLRENAVRKSLWRIRSERSVSTTRSGWRNSNMRSSARV